MPNYRMDRTGEDIMRELTAILRTVKDPRVSGTLLSIVRVDVTRDLSYATVYVSSMDGLEAAKEEILLCRHYQHLVINHDGAVEESARAILALMNGLPTQDLPVYPDKEAFINHFLTH